MTVTFAQAIEPVTADIWVKTLGPLFLCILCAYMYLHMHKSPENATRIKSWTVFWFILSGMIHSELEFSFIFFRNNSWSSKALDLYSAADFRYGYPMEAGTAAMELITALIDGPLCLLAAYGYVHRRYWYHPVVLVVTTMQLYGLTWFVFHPMFSTETHVTSDPILYWSILVGMNLPWAVFPPILWYKSYNVLCAQSLSLQKARKY